ncbi:hypothetical protein LI328DRAFT_157932 [Trichoderma asperelloides]|nr:hypothetical protein LI328DRAFT_157932 [Trichoderma asperelloides]
MYRRLPFPSPWSPSDKPLPSLLYGAASAVGAYVLKLAVLSNIHPVITVAGQVLHFVETLIGQSRGDTVIDHRQGNDTLVEAIKAALGGQKLEFPFDAVSEKRHHWKHLQSNRQRCWKDGCCVGGSSR